MVSKEFVPVQGWELPIIKNVSLLIAGGRVACHKKFELR